MARHNCIEPLARLRATDWSVCVVSVLHRDMMRPAYYMAPERELARHNGILPFIDHLYVFN